MTKKHFKLIAFALADAKPQMDHYSKFADYMLVKQGWEMAVDSMKEHLTADNAAFDADKFDTELQAVLAYLKR